MSSDVLYCSTKSKTKRYTIHYNRRLEIEKEITFDKLEQAHFCANIA